jgi:mycothiol synthase
MENQEMGTKTRNGFLARSAEMEDLLETTNLLNQWSLAKIGVEDYSPGEIENDWGTPGFERSRDTRLVYDSEKNLVAYSDVWVDAELPVRPYVRIYVLPGQNTTLLGKALLEWAIDRAREGEAKLPPGVRLSLHSNAVSTDKEHAMLLTANGFKLIRHSWQMVIDLDHTFPTPEFPDRINLRTYDHERDGEAVYRADYEAFRDHWGFVEESFEEGYPKWLHSMLQDEYYDPKLWFLAIDGEKIAGGAICRPVSWEDPAMGWVRSLFVRRSWRRQGIALGLLNHTFQVFKEMGKDRVGLGVDASNLTGATSLYTKAGMHIYRQYDRYERELRPGIELGTQAVEQS